ncbi:hypothetical protein AAC387_Pa06g1917 [Persea americana]
MRQFLWSGNASSSKISYVNWAQVTLPKDEGGLGIRRLKEVNDASLLKLGWQASTLNSIGSSWFKNRYFKLTTIWNPNNTIYGSCIWKRIRSLDHLLHQGSVWNFGNGQDINVWHDTWLGDRPISTDFQHLHFPSDQSLASLFHSRSWHIPSLLPEAIQNQLFLYTSTLSPCHLARDYLSWKGAPDGQLSMNLAWNIIRSRGPKLQWPNLIWDGISLTKLSCFGWRLMLNRTPTETRLQRLGFSLASRCSVCCNDEDSSTHVFFYYAQARSLWQWLLQAANIQHPVNCSASSLWHVLSIGNDLAGKKYMAAVFIRVIYALWKARNSAIFYAHPVPFNQTLSQLQDSLCFSLKKISKAFCSHQLKSVFCFLRITEALSHNVL